MIKCVEEKFPVDVVKEYEEAPTSTWKLVCSSHIDLRIR